MASRPDERNFAMQLLNLAPLGSPPYDRFEHHEDVYRLLRIPAKHQKSFQAFTAFVAQVSLALVMDR